VSAPEYWLPIGDGWHLWRDFELRGAGFPAAWLLELADPGAGARADAWRVAETAEREAQARFCGALEAGLAQAGEETRRALRSALGRARKGQVPEASGTVAEHAGAAREWLAGRETAAVRRRELDEEVRAAGLRIGAALRRIARDPRFREALLWQNRTALERADALLESPVETSNSATRQKERLLASYIQRYCGKNDRIGFFGPNAWGWLVADGPPLEVRPGPSLLAGRSARLEAWAIDALGDRLAGDPELRAGLAPRRMPTVRLEGRTLHHSIDRATELPEAYAAVMAACDGQTSARRIAVALGADASLELTEEEVLSMLGELADRRAIVWTVDVPTSGGRPEALLRAELERVEGPARGRALEALDRLEAARDDVGRAAGSPELLDGALRRLDETFIELTEAEPSRRHGQTYAGRTVGFEMCRRDVEVEVGPGLWRELAPPLCLLLESARWFTHEIAARYRPALAALHRRLCSGPEARVDYLRFAAHLPELFPGGQEAGSIVDQVRQELRARWRQVLGFAGDEREVFRSAAELRAAVGEAFRAPAPGWPAARHQSVDVLIAGEGADRMVVLGEIHPGLNTLLIPDLPHPYGDEEVLFGRRDREIGRASVAPVWSRARTHLDYYSRSPDDYEVEHSAARGWRPRDRVLAAADLVVERAGSEGGPLRVRTRDRRIAFDAIAFLEHHLIAECHQHFSPVGGGAHTPRIVVDRVVVARERWAPAPSEVEFARVDDAALRFARAREFAARLGLPRFVFLRTAEEIKPTYVDFDSPLYVDLAAKAIRAASALTISEMLPGFDQLWLPDAEGRRYTSELRLVAVDPQSWAPDA
jgi:Lantibiotic dehydratase, N terminus